MAQPRFVPVAFHPEVMKFFDQIEKLEKQREKIQVRIDRLEARATKKMEEIYGPFPEPPAERWWKREYRYPPRGKMR